MDKNKSCKQFDWKEGVSLKLGCKDDLPRKYSIIDPDFLYLFSYGFASLSYILLKLN